jgi:hypothetical protein
VDYNELIASKATANSICNWINWDLTPSTSILTEAEAAIYSKLRVSEMESLDEGTIAQGATSLEMPADFIAAKSFRRVGQTAGVIPVLDRQLFEERLPLDSDGSFQSGPPMECTIYGDPQTAYFNFAADVDTDYRLLYFSRPAALSVSNPTNWLTRQYPLVVRATCLWLGFMHRKEFQAAQVWAGIAASLLDACNGNGDLAQAINQFEMFWNKA